MDQSKRQVIKTIDESLLDDFRRQYMAEFRPDSLYEAYVGAWMAYHYAANQIDGDIDIPQSSGDRGLINKAVSVGILSMEIYLSGRDMHKPRQEDEPEMWKLWQSAKLESLRRLKL